MRRFKKTMAVVLTGAMCLSMAACGKTTDNNTTTAAVGNSTEQSTTQAQELTFKNDVAVSALKDAVASALGEKYLPNVAVDTLEGFGITADMYEEFLYEVPMISVNVDTLIVVKAKEGKVADVEAKLNEFRDANINDLLQYPSNLTKIQCSQVVVMGNYVAFVQLGADEGVLATANLPENTSEDDIAKLEMDAITAHNEMAIEAMKEALTK